VQWTWIEPTNLLLSVTQYGAVFVQGPPPSYFSNATCPTLWRHGEPLLPALEINFTTYSPDIVTQIFWCKLGLKWGLPW